MRTPVIHYGRPPLAEGDHGDIHLTPQRKINGMWRKVGGGQPQRWRARTRIRDLDGVYREIERFRTTRSEALEALLEAVAPRKS